MRIISPCRGIPLTLLITWLLLLAVACSSAQPDQISGSITDGFRVIQLAPLEKKVQLTVYRGDYIKFSLDQDFPDAVLLIPGLSIKATLSNSSGAAPYFKMKSPGSFPFSIGDITGVLTVLEYREPNYKELTSAEAANIIQNVAPFILDVRTPQEYGKGHLKGAVLIPVQVLQTRLTELNAYKNQDILIYCATGNRSTVAAKILIDAGFKRIYNMRHGITDWSRKKYPVIR
jgi:rhodanese-related sulfurtransferase